MEYHPEEHIPEYVEPFSDEEKEWRQVFAKFRTALEEKWREQQKERKQRIDKIVDKRLEPNEKEDKELTKEEKHKRDNEAESIDWYARGKEIKRSQQKGYLYN